MLLPVFAIEQAHDERLISLPQASVETGIPLDRLRSWRKGHYLNPVGKMRGDAPNGGLLIFRLADVLRLRDDPPARGRRPGKL